MAALLFKGSHAALRPVNVLTEQQLGLFLLIKLTGAAKTTFSDNQNVN